MDFLRGKLAAKKLLTTFLKKSILDVWRTSEYASEADKVKHQSTSKIFELSQDSAPSSLKDCLWFDGRGIFSLSLPIITAFNPITPNYVSFYCLIKHWVLHILCISPTSWLKIFALIKFRDLQCSPDLQPHFPAYGTLESLWPFLLNLILF